MLKSVLQKWKQFCYIFMHLKKKNLKTFDRFLSVCVPANFIKLKKCVCITFFLVVILARGFADSDFALKTCNLLCRSGSLSKLSCCLCLSCFILFLTCYVARFRTGLMLRSLLVWWPCIVFVYPYCVWGCRCPVAQAPEYVALSPVRLASAQSLMGLKEGEKRRRDKGRGAGNCGGMSETGHWLLLSRGAGCLAGLLRQLEGLLGWAQGGWHAMRWGREFIPVIPINMKKDPPLE